MNKIYSMLGIAKKGGNISIGYDATLINIKSNKSELVLLASDASDKTKKNVQFFCDQYDAKYIEYGEKEVLGKCLGRKVVGVLSITDKNIASYIINNI
ncbi:MULTISPECIES: ribosomal L7Ae/L30e/S12e/Gadd45 family protein [Sedimentibacter]|uniref:Ribosomal L7Ae/L30e/S12e/Gadd45 family protein n=1 Tax=Sedimentibacter hydroxybenzoicus DSM 7310 TaxID=1123245 RepID=A0A974BJL1_SEDHY|nr:MULTISPECIES: ribosomal L7Ae/L30e/S12e/Gadd45 family protein [Sedimentibacter]NYB74373.1 ribosomal L7Ae/L30e/S12e/Gadd45 family protein [Sedimentibacter hydroxybenzoicus DSM 7310]